MALGTVSITVSAQSSPVGPNGRIGRKNPQSPQACTSTHARPANPTSRRNGLQVGNPQGDVSPSNVDEKLSFRAIAAHMKEHHNFGARYVHPFPLQNPPAAIPLLLPPPAVHHSSPLLVIHLIQQGGKDSLFSITVNEHCSASSDDGVSLRVTAASARMTSLSKRSASYGRRTIKRRCSASSPRRRGLRHQREGPLARASEAQADAQRP